MMHNINCAILCPFLVLSACVVNAALRPTDDSLAAARHQFHTNIVHPFHATDPLPDPPHDKFSIVTYKSSVGPLHAYLSTPPSDHQKHPAIVWITGGDCNSIGDVWSPQPAENDQSASAYRKAGIIMLFPALRGGNRNTASEEQFYGEVDDVVAAADFLATQPGVDPQRIYLGGHSTGGTLALLTAEYSPRFRAVFSLGPVDTITSYGNMFPHPFNADDPTEFRLRNPINWLASI